MKVLTDAVSEHPEDPSSLGSLGNALLSQAEIRSQTMIWEAKTQSQEEEFRM